MDLNTEEMDITFTYPFKSSFEYLKQIVLLCVK